MRYDSYVFDRKVPRSRILSRYCTDFNETDVIECERNILSLLNWNLNQLTTFHFVENLHLQGIDFESDLVRDSDFSKNKSHQNTDAIIEDVSFEDLCAMQNDENISQNYASISTIHKYNDRKSQFLKNSQFKLRQETQTDFSAIIGRKLEIIEVIRYKQLVIYFQNLSNLLYELYTYKASRIAAA